MSRAKANLPGLSESLKRLCDFIAFHINPVPKGLIIVFSASAYVAGYQPGISPDPKMEANMKTTILAVLTILTLGVGVANAASQTQGAQRYDQVNQALGGQGG